MRTENFTIMFCGPAVMEAQRLYQEILSRDGHDKGEEKVDKFFQELKKVEQNPYIGNEVPRGGPRIKNGRVVARRGLRILEIGGIVIFYKVSLSTVNIYHMFRRGERYGMIVERDLAD